LVGKTEVNKPLRNNMNTWEANIKMDLEEIWGDWIDLAQNRNNWHVLVCIIINVQVP
jgi:hypothetical protein